MRLHATLAEGTFLLLRKSYDIFGRDAFVRSVNIWFFLGGKFSKEFFRQNRVEMFVQIVPLV